MPDTLVLVDGSSYLFRAYHALPPLTNSDDEPTGAMYGVLNMLRKLMASYETKSFAVVFDTKGKTFRHDMYADYKANRPEMPQELACQIEPLHNMIEALGIPLIKIQGVEADDVIGTLTRMAVEKKVPVVISTGDKDMAQLVTDNVTLVNTMTGTEMDIAGVKEKFGVMPESIIDYLALIGDKVDNVPGVEKVGPKTAVKWLDKYQTLEEIMTNADEIKGKVGENLKAALEQLPLSKKLVTIDTHVEMPYSLADLTLKSPDNAFLKESYTRYEFKTWLKDLHSDDAAIAETTATTKAPTYECIQDEAALLAIIRQIKSKGRFAVDTETTSLNQIDAKVVGVSLACEANHGVYIPFGHTYEEAPQQLSEAVVWQHLKPIFEDISLVKIGHNLKYDMNVLKNHDMVLAGNLEDSMLASYVYNSTASRHDMDSLAEKYLGCQTISYTDVAGKGAKQITFDQVHLEEATPYAAEDAAITLTLFDHFHDTISDNKGLSAIYERIEKPLMPVLAEMERTGVLLDVDVLTEHSAHLGKKIDELKKDIFEHAGSEFNLDSPKQLQKVLYEDLELPVIAKTPKGQPSTAEAVLSELSFDHPFVEQILTYRSLSKLKSTYTDKLPELVHPKTARVHASFHQAVTATGRLSSSEPNLQNIPIRTEEGRHIRSAFIVPEGTKMLACDYSQIELRIMAHLSQDDGLLNAFSEGADVHQQTAAEVFGVNLADVTADQRRSAKAINFGLIYGMSGFGLAKQLGVSRNAAESYIDLYFKRYPGVKEYMETTKEFAAKKGYVQTLLGRRLYLPEIKSSNRNRRMAAERTAINAPMQGTAADIIKLAMIHVADWIEQEAPEIKLLIQVHDELVFEVPEKLVATAEPEISKIMCGVMDLDVPLEVGSGVGLNWEEAH